MIKYKFLKNQGALNVAQEQTESLVDARNMHQHPADGLLAAPIPKRVLDLVPADVARAQNVIPVASDGETIILSCLTPDDIALADRLRFMLAKNVRLVAASPHRQAESLAKYYPQPAKAEVTSALSAKPSPGKMRRETSLDLVGSPSSPPPTTTGGWFGRNLGKNLAEFKQGYRGLEDQSNFDDEEQAFAGNKAGGGGMWFYVVEEGQQVLKKKSDGTMEVIVGPKRVWKGWSKFHPMKHYVAHPGEFIIVRFRDGRQQHLRGPAEMWADPRIHREITVEECLQVGGKEAVIVYSQTEGETTIHRRVVSGPTQFMPEPGEWLHTFSWHASASHDAGKKIPNALVFQKLWLMPDQMYHDVEDVRTADDALLTIRLMIFFELVDIERMLDATHDPIGDFINAASSDVVEFVGQHDFESFKHNTARLNDIETYAQLTGRATQCGYKLNKVVYRGYGAPNALQKMHDDAIQARTQLQLDRATEQQSQELENYKLDCQIERASRRRGEQTSEVQHNLELDRQKQEAKIQRQEARRNFQREQRQREAQQHLEIQRNGDAQQREHFAALREMGVDLTAYLTQSRADRVIELRGASGTHVHLGETENGDR